MSLDRKAVKFYTVMNAGKDGHRCNKRQSDFHFISIIKIIRYILEPAIKQKRQMNKTTKCTKNK